MAISQLIGWGTVYVPFPLMVAPMEAELGWSRVLLNGAYTAGLLASGLAAVPAGRWLDRHGPRAMMNIGMLAAALLLVALSLVQHPAAYVAVWVLLGVVQAMCLWTPPWPWWWSRRATSPAPSPPSPSSPASPPRCSSR